MASSMARSREQRTAEEQVLREGLATLVGSGWRKVNSSD